MRRLSLVLVLPLFLVACGAAQHRSAPARTLAGAFTVHRYGQGATRVWVFAPARRPKLVVLYVHGLGDQRETTPYHHRLWLAHLAHEGYEVVYPAFERTPYAPHGLLHLIQGVRAAMPHVATGVPMSAIGYSRGGRLVVDYASVSAAAGLVPSRILSVFPSGTMDQPLDLAPLSGHTKILILAGDHDYTVSNVGANQLVSQLAESGFPYGDVHFEVVRSRGFFIADHLSVLNDDPDARHAYWARADRFFAPLVQR